MTDTPNYSIKQGLLDVIREKIRQYPILYVLIGVLTTGTVPNASSIMEYVDSYFVTQAETDEIIAKFDEFRYTSALTLIDMQINQIEDSIYRAQKEKDSAREEQMKARLLKAEIRRKIIIEAIDEGKK